MAYSTIIIVSPPPPLSPWRIPLYCTPPPQSMAYSILYCTPLSPWRILEDCGAAFIMGCLGGGLYSFTKGYRNSPPVSHSHQLDSLFEYWFRGVWPDSFDVMVHFEPCRVTSGWEVSLQSRPEHQC